MAKSKKDTQDDFAHGKFTLKCGELVYQHFIEHYLTRWYKEKTVTAHVYAKAMKELQLLRGKKNITGKQEGKEGAKARDHKAEKEAVRAIGRQSPKSHSGDSKQPSKPSDGPPPGHKIRAEVMENQNLILDTIHLNKKVDRLRNEKADVLVELQEKYRTINRLTTELENSRAEIGDLRMRMNKLASDKMRDNNPNIADLSDKNRPTELGRKFSEIYENEWSDAFEKLNKQKDDDKVRVLFEIVKSTFVDCEERFRQQEQDIRNILLEKSAQHGESSRGSSPEAVDKKMTVTKTVRTQNLHSVLKDVRKQFSPETAINVAKEYSSKELPYLLDGFDISTIHQTLVIYAEKCAEICWLMLVCDPPMSMSMTDADNKPYDLNVYNPYTRSVKDLKTPVVELNVWPALYLHFNGPLVAKGIAQPGEGRVLKKKALVSKAL